MTEQESNELVERLMSYKQDSDRARVFGQPGFGIMPEKIWKEHRVIGIAEAIVRQIQSGTHIWGSMIQWNEEMGKLLKDLESMCKES